MCNGKLYTQHYRVDIIKSMVVLCVFNINTKLAHVVERVYLNSVEQERVILSPEFVLPKNIELNSPYNS